MCLLSKTREWRGLKGSVNGKVVFAVKDISVTVRLSLSSGQEQTCRTPLEGPFASLLSFTSNKKETVLGALQLLYVYSTFRQFRSVMLIIVAIILVYITKTKVTVIFVVKDL